MKRNLPKPVTHSIRLEGGIYRDLVKEASDQSISFNNLVARILKKHVEFDKFVPDLQFVMISKAMIRNTLEAPGQIGQSDNELISAGESVGRMTAKDTILTMGMQLNKDSLLYFLDTVFCRYMNFADCQRFPKGAKESFYLRHGLGEKWSLFLKGYVAGGFKIVLNEDVKIETTKDGITFVA
jgi:predicted DNA-binding ribbon-helix-helix protein